ncbi:uncharacterized protein TNCV_886991 [Trichonephila clavipes]|uniref:Uncharacterized protein n=1 Tax=Trichonephila clavipes TaxID=2585209 RepID=A0A8X6URU2_TRICX|nr:uncharacterized protein TNCV_886991 [Trichonephila clavipes]
MSSLPLLWYHYSQNILKSSLCHGSLVVKTLDHGWRVMSSSPVPLKTRRVGERCTINMLRAQTSSRWWAVVIRRGMPAQVSSSSFDHGSKL